MSDARQKADRPAGNQTADPAEPIITPPPSAYGSAAPAADAGAGADEVPQPAAQPTRANAGAARAEEHAAPAPTTRIGPKLWILAGLVALIAVVAIASGY